MRTFVSATLLAFAFAQEEPTAAETAEETWSSVKNWFAATTSEYLTLEQQHQKFGVYSSEKLQHLDSTISLDSTAVGANFVTVALDLMSNNTKHWEAGSYSALYFQIEEPVKEDDGHEHRLLQEDPAAEEEKVVTGTGMYEGMIGILRGQGSTSGVVELSANKNIWGDTTLADVDTWYSRFGNDQGATATVDADPWQAADAKLQTFTAGNATHPGVWHAQAWRVASAVDSLRFKFLPGHSYRGCAGHKFWRKDAPSSEAPTQAQDSGMVMFMFDGAAATYIGLSAVATVLALF